MASLSRRDLMLEQELSDTDIYLIAIDWIRCYTAKKNSQEDFDTAWASSMAIDMCIEDRPDDLWRLIEAIHTLDESSQTMAFLSAGPIEDLLAHWGEAFIDRIETKARVDPSFATVLGGVWKNSMTDEVWCRLQAVWDLRGWDGNPA